MTFAASHPKLPALRIDTRPDYTKEAHYYLLRFIARELLTRTQDRPEGQLVELGGDKETYSAEAFTNLYNRFLKAWDAYAARNKAKYLTQVKTKLSQVSTDVKDHKQDPAFQLNSISDWYKFLNLNPRIDPIARSLLHVLERATAWMLDASLSPPAGCEHFLQVSMMQRMKLCIQFEAPAKTAAFGDTKNPAPVLVYASFFWLFKENINWETQWLKKIKTNLQKGEPPTPRPTPRGDKEASSNPGTPVTGLLIPTPSPPLFSLATEQTATVVAAGSMPGLILDAIEEDHLPNYQQPRQQREKSSWSTARFKARGDSEKYLAPDNKSPDLPAPPLTLDIDAALTITDYLYMQENIVLTFFQQMRLDDQKHFKPGLSSVSHLYEDNLTKVSNYNAALHKYLLAEQLLKQEGGFRKDEEFYLNANNLNVTQAMDHLRLRFHLSAYQLQNQKELPLSCYQYNINVLAMHWYIIKIKNPKLNLLDVTEQHGSAFDKTICFLLCIAAKLKTTLRGMNVNPKLLDSIRFPAEFEALPEVSLHDYFQHHKTNPLFARIVNMIDPAQVDSAKNSTCVIC